MTASKHKLFLIWRLNEIFQTWNDNNLHRAELFQTSFVDLDTIYGSIGHTKRQFNFFHNIFRRVLVQTMCECEEEQAKLGAG